jgi:hypothetical protein
MKTKLIITITIILLVFINCKTRDLVSENPPLSKRQTAKLYNAIISEIEFIDAEAIDVRNNNKKVKWKDYKDYHKKKFEDIASKEEFKNVFLNFAKGFTNGHAHFEFKLDDTDKHKPTKFSNIKIGYTHPTLSFFDLESKKEIASINNKPIKDVFNFFENYETVSSSTIRSKRSFKRAFERNNLKIDGNYPTKIIFKDGSKKEVAYKVPDKIESPLELYSKGLDLSKYTNWEKVATGYKAALLKRNDVALIKIKNFLYFKGRGGNIACDSIAADSTICSDIRKIKQGLVSIRDKINYLIFDLQDNFGGSENTPFLKMFSPEPFYDLRVEYKKTGLLKNESLRNHLNYNNTSAENWFKNIENNGIYDNVLMGKFLPVRADFCRGSENCEIKPIFPNDSITKGFKKYIILVNEGTASSADDFAFRFSKFPKTVIAGQPQSADLTYALVTVLFYLDKNNTIQKMYLGNNQRDYTCNGTELVKIQIPYSKTVDEDGFMLQGNPLDLDFEVPLTEENFENREVDVLQKTIIHFLEKR